MSFYEPLISDVPHMSLNYHFRPYLIITVYHSMCLHEKVNHQFWRYPLFLIGFDMIFECSLNNICYQSYNNNNNKIIKILFVATSYQSHITKLQNIFTKLFTVMYNILFTKDIYIKGWVDM